MSFGTCHQNFLTAWLREVSWWQYGTHRHIYIERAQDHLTFLSSYRTVRKNKRLSFVITETSPHNPPQHRTSFCETYNISWFESVCVYVCVFNGGWVPRVWDTNTASYVVRGRGGAKKTSEWSMGFGCFMSWLVGETFIETTIRNAFHGICRVHHRRIARAVDWMEECWLQITHVW